jgi:3-oxoacyl-[acyl-carrier protein] reductase
MNRFKDRVAVITGGSQGIGRSYVDAFVHEGARVAVLDINDPSVTVADHANAPVVGFQVDVINNAAYYEGLTFQPFDQISSRDWDRSMNVNVKGVWHVCSAVAPHMRERNYGRIINISSNVVFMGKPNFLHYVTSKGAVWALSNAMSREFSGTSITVNCVAPGYTITSATRGMGSPETVFELERQILEAQSIKRLLDSEDLVGAVLYLASDQAAMVTGQTITVDGGVIVG